MSATSSINSTAVSSSSNGSNSHSSNVLSSASNIVILENQILDSNDVVAAAGLQQLSNSGTLKLTRDCAVQYSNIINSYTASSVNSSSSSNNNSSSSNNNSNSGTTIVGNNSSQMSTVNIIPGDATQTNSRVQVLSNVQLVSKGGSQSSTFSYVDASGKNFNVLTSSGKISTNKLISVPITKVKTFNHIAQHQQPQQTQIVSSPMQHQPPVSSMQKMTVPRSIQLVTRIPNSTISVSNGRVSQISSTMPSTTSHQQQPPTQQFTIQQYSESSVNTPSTLEVTSSASGSVINSINSGGTMSSKSVSTKNKTTSSLKVMQNQQLNQHNTTKASVGKGVNVNLKNVRNNSKTALSGVNSQYYIKSSTNGGSSSHPTGSTTSIYTTSPAQAVYHNPTPHPPQQPMQIPVGLTATGKMKNVYKTSKNQLIQLQQQQQQQPHHSPQRSITPSASFVGTVPTSSALAQGNNTIPTSITTNRYQYNQSTPVSVSQSQTCTTASSNYKPFNHIYAGGTTATLYDSSTTSASSSSSTMINSSDQTVPSVTVTGYSSIGKGRKYSTVVNSESNAVFATSSVKVKSVSRGRNNSLTNNNLLEATYQRYSASPSKSQTQFPQPSALANSAQQQHAIISVQHASREEQSFNNAQQMADETSSRIIQNFGQKTTSDGNKLQNYKVQQQYAYYGSDNLLQSSGNSSTSVRSTNSESGAASNDPSDPRFYEEKSDGRKNSTSEVITYADNIPLREGFPSSYNYNHRDDDDQIGVEVRPAPVDTSNGRHQILQAILQDHTYFAVPPELKVTEPPAQIPATPQHHPLSSPSIANTTISTILYQQQQQQHQQHTHQLHQQQQQFIDQKLTSPVVSALASSPVITVPSNITIATTGVPTLHTQMRMNTLISTHASSDAVTTTVAEGNLKSTIPSATTLDYIYQRQPQDDDANSVISTGSRNNMDNDLGEETETAPEGEGDDDSVTRCICDLTHDDGYMICCDKCSAWQHVDCMGIDRMNIPDEYNCEICQPRPVDKTRARMLQMEKRKEQSLFLANNNLQVQVADPSVSSTNLIGSAAGSMTSASGKSANQYTTGKALAGSKKGKSSGGSSKKKAADGTSSGTKKSGKKALESTISRVNGKRKELKKAVKKKVKTTEQSAEKMTNMIRTWIDNYERAITNHYSPELRARLQAFGKMQSQNPLLSSDRLISAASVTNLVQKCTTVPHAGGKILISTGDIEPKTPIIEIRGKYMLSSQHKQLQSLFNMAANGKLSNNKNAGPFLFMYQLTNGAMELCVDTRTYGNDARFVRRSCRPNAEILHNVEKGSVHLYIVSTTNIKANTEITIKHDEQLIQRVGGVVILTHTTVTNLCACGLIKECQYSAQLSEGLQSAGTNPVAVSSNTSSMQIGQSTSTSKNSKSKTNNGAFGDIDKRPAKKRNSRSTSSNAESRLRSISSSGDSTCETMVYIQQQQQPPPPQHQMLSPLQQQMIGQSPLSPLPQTQFQQIPAQLISQQFHQSALHYIHNQQQDRLQQLQQEQQQQKLQQEQQQQQLQQEQQQQQLQQEQQQKQLQQEQQQHNLQQELQQQQLQKEQQEKQQQLQKEQRQQQQRLQQEQQHQLQQKQQQQLLQEQQQQLLQEQQQQLLQQEQQQQKMQRDHQQHQLQLEQQQLQLEQQQQLQQDHQEQPMQQEQHHQQFSQNVAVQSQPVYMFSPSPTHQSPIIVTQQQTMHPPTPPPTSPVMGINSRATFYKEIRSPLNSPPLNMSGQPPMIIPSMLSPGKSISQLPSPQLSSTSQEQHTNPIIPIVGHSSLVHQTTAEQQSHLELIQQQQQMHQQHIMEDILKIRVKSPTTSPVKRQPSPSPSHCMLSPPPPVPIIQRALSAEILKNELFHSHYQQQQQQQPLLQTTTLSTLQQPLHQQKQQQQASVLVQPLPQSSIKLEYPQAEVKQESLVLLSPPHSVAFDCLTTTSTQIKLEHDVKTEMAPVVDEIPTIKQEEITEPKSPLKEELVLISEINKDELMSSTGISNLNTSLSNSATNSPIKSCLQSQTAACVAAGTSSGNSSNSSPHSVHQSSASTKKKNCTVSKDANDVEKKEEKKPSRKLTREERKMEAIVKAFEKMEQSQQRKQELKEQRKEGKRRSVSSSTPDEAAPSGCSSAKKKSLSIQKRKKKKNKCLSQHFGSPNPNRKRKVSKSSSKSSKKISSPRATSPEQKNCTAENRPYEDKAAELLLTFSQSTEQQSPEEPYFGNDIKPIPSDTETTPNENNNTESMQSIMSNLPLLSSACMLVEAAVAPLEQVSNAATPMPHEQDFKFPQKAKTKKSMSREWLSGQTVDPTIPYPKMTADQESFCNSKEKFQNDNEFICRTTTPLPFEEVAASAVGPIGVEVSEPNICIVAKKVEEFIAQNSPQPDEISGHKWEEKSSSSSSSSMGATQEQSHTPASCGGTMSESAAAKKRWLRQAISEETDELTQASSSPPPPNGFTTPLKKRRVICQSEETAQPQSQQHLLAFATGSQQVMINTSPSYSDSSLYWSNIGPPSLSYSLHSRSIVDEKQAMDLSRTAPQLRSSQPPRIKPYKIVPIAQALTPLHFTDPDPLPMPPPPPSTTSNPPSVVQAHHHLIPQESRGIPLQVPVQLPPASMVITYEPSPPPPPSAVAAMVPASLMPPESPIQHTTAQEVQHFVPQHQYQEEVDVSYPESHEQTAPILARCITRSKGSKKYIESPAKLETASPSPSESPISVVVETTEKHSVTSSSCSGSMANSDIDEDVHEKPPIDDQQQQEQEQEQELVLQPPDEPDKQQQPLEEHVQETEPEIVNSKIVDRVCDDSTIPQFAASGEAERKEIVEQSLIIPTVTGEPIEIQEIIIENEDSALLQKPEVILDEVEVAQKHKTVDECDDVVVETKHEIELSSAGEICAVIESSESSTRPSSPMEIDRRTVSGKMSPDGYQGLNGRGKIRLTLQEEDHEKNELEDLQKVIASFHSENIMNLISRNKKSKKSISHENNGESRGCTKKEARSRHINKDCNTGALSLHRPVVPAEDVFQEVIEPTMAVVESGGESAISLEAAKLQPSVEETHISTLGRSYSHPCWHSSESYRDSTEVRSLSTLRPDIPQISYSSPTTYQSTAARNLLSSLSTGSEPLSTLGSYRSSTSSLLDYPKPSIGSATGMGNSGIYQYRPSTEISSLLEKGFSSSRSSSFSTLTSSITTERSTDRTSGSSYLLSSSKVTDNLSTLGAAGSSYPKIFTKTASSDPRLNPALSIPEPATPITPKRKLSINEYRQRKMQSCTPSTVLSSETAIDCVRSSTSFGENGTGSNVISSSLSSNDVSSSICKELSLELEMELGRAEEDESSKDGSGVGLTEDVSSAATTITTSMLTSTTNASVIAAVNETSSTDEAF